MAEAKKKKKRNKKKIEVKVVEEQEIWDKEEKTPKSEREVKKLVPKQFHKWIKIFEKKASERMLTRKMQDHVIDLKEEFILRKEKVYLLSRKKKRKKGSLFRSR